MTEKAPRDHGGDLGAGIARHGGARTAWIDLSTGINPVAYPVRKLPEDVWNRLPEAEQLAALISAARTAYGVAPGASIAAVPGLSAAIRCLPRLFEGMGSRAVSIPQPTYNEHAAAFRDADWRVEERPSAATRAAVIVNPNNPDGRVWERHELLTLAEALPWLAVDESFADPAPQLSLADAAGEHGAEGLLILRSFGKFYGLAGLRLGFVIGPRALTDRLAEMLGPWAVSGPALVIGRQALEDVDWRDAARVRIARDAVRLKAVGRAAGWRVVGEAGLFVTFATPDAVAAHEALARRHIWTRVFPYSRRWLRMGLPGDDAAWARLEAALASGL